MTNFDSGKLKLKEKLGYALGDTACNIAWRPIMYFLPIFYTDVFKLPTKSVAMLLLFCRLMDGGADVIMGTIADRTQTKYGKFRPWLLWTALPLGLITALTFTTPGLDLTGRLIYAYVTYILLNLLYTACNIPYSALMGVMTPNLNERTSLSSYRFFGAYLGGLITQGALIYLVSLLGGSDKNLGYQYSMFIFAAVLVIFILITFFSTKERVLPQKNQESSIKKDLKDLISNKPWLILLTIGFVFVTFNSIKQGATMYYFSHYVHKEYLAPSFMVALLLVSMVAALTTTPLSLKFGKKNLFIYVMIFTGITTGMMYMAKPEDISLIFILGCVSEFAAAIMPVLFFSMLGDSADYSEFKNNRRATGLIYSAGTFAMKFGGGVAGAITMLILNMYHYDGQALIKSAESLEGIKLSMTLVPALFIIVGIIVMLFYPLSKQKLAEIEVELVKRRS